MDIIERLQNDTDQEEIMENIKSSRKTLTLLKNMELYMIVNITKLTKEVSNVYAPWKAFLSDETITEKAK